MKPQRLPCNVDVCEKTRMESRADSDESTCQITTHVRTVLRSGTGTKPVNSRNSLYTTAFLKETRIHRCPHIICNVTESREGREGFYFSFFIAKEMKRAHVRKLGEVKHSALAPQTSKSGGGPSIPCRSTEDETSELAKTLPQDTESMRDHRRVHAKKAERLRTRGASRARAAASISTN